MSFQTCLSASSIKSLTVPEIVRLPYMSISNKQPLHRGPISRTVTPFNANIDRLKNKKNITACGINLLNVKVAYAIAI